MTLRKTYTKLMKKIEEGYAEVSAWTNDRYEPALAEVIFYKSNGTSKREWVEVTNLPNGSKAV